MTGFPCDERPGDGQTSGFAQIAGLPRSAALVPVRTVRCSRNIERHRHLFLHCLEFERSPPSRARQVDDELPVDTTRLTAHDNDPVRQGHGFVDIVGN
jgi:hypothetical protein